MSLEPKLRQLLRAGRRHVHSQALVEPDGTSSPSSGVAGLTHPEDLDVSEVTEGSCRSGNLSTMLKLSKEILEEL